MASTADQPVTVRIAVSCSLSHITGFDAILSIAAYQFLFAPCMQLCTYMHVKEEDDSRGDLTCTKESEGGRHTCKQGLQMFSMRRL
jgi:hypothetical protein